MACGLFGKLQTKRDFVTVDLPRDFVVVWEEWLQRVMGESQSALGDDWLPTYLSAPLWRFHLGAGTAGSEVVGVVMPSVDGVGRKFPLTVACCAQDGARFADTEGAEAEAWYAAVEDYMLHLLDAEPDYEASLAALRALPDFPAAPPAEDVGAFAALGGEAFVQCDASQLPAAVAQLKAREVGELLQKTSLWWTIGGADWPAAAFLCTGLPTGAAFTAMLSGGFAQGPDQSI